MTVSTTPLSKPFSRDLTLESVLTTTASKDLRGGATTLWGLNFHNAVAGAAFASVKIYDHNGDGLVVGTDLPEMIIPLLAGANVTVVIVEGLPLAAGLSCAGATEDGNVVTTAPTQTVTAYFETA